MDFSHFDSRQYPVVPVQKGYSEWVTTYEQSVEDEMDLRLLEGLTIVQWDQFQQVVDLACGTGRIGAWLHSKGISAIDGVDFTGKMLALAQARGIYRHLMLGDVLATPLVGAVYEMGIVVLADEHLPDVRPLYAEAARVIKPGGYFVIVGYHPHFLLKGLITHFHRADGEAVGIESYVHLFSDHVKAAHRAGWMLREMNEGIVDESWLKKKPKWEQYLNHPVSFGMVWQKYLRQHGN